MLILRKFGRGLEINKVQLQTSQFIMTDVIHTDRWSAIQYGQVVSYSVRTGGQLFARANT